MKRITKTKPLIAAPLLSAALLLFASAPRATAESAGLPPEGVLRSSVSLSAAAALSGWDADGSFDSSRGLQYGAVGFGAEYGVTNWSSLGFNWQPGVLLSGLTGNGGVLGTLSDFSLGSRIGITGPGGLIPLSFLHTSLILGVHAPLPSTEDSVAEPDTHLWGMEGGLAADYIPVPWFLLNFSGIGRYSPRQASDNPAFLRRAVYHPLDTRFELEFQFRRLNPDGVILHIPVAYGYSMESARVLEGDQGDGLNDQRQYLSVGMGYTMAVRSAPWPFELRFQFTTPVYGVNQSQTSEILLIGRVDIPINKKK
jgi:hypothetical protein